MRVRQHAADENNKPRAWLAQGKRISVRNAPTHFGEISYEITSDEGNGRIRAQIVLPSRKQPENVLLRLRHPRAAPIERVNINGAAWPDFDAVKEVVTLHDLSGAVDVEVIYAP
ncbi:MAG: hypothetical protein AB7T27_10770 [Kiritimatiellia bacterium]